MTKAMPQHASPPRSSAASAPNGALTDAAPSAVTDGASTTAADAARPGALLDGAPQAGTQTLLRGLAILEAAAAGSAPLGAPAAVDDREGLACWGIALVMVFERWMTERAARSVGARVVATVVGLAAWAATATDGHCRRPARRGPLRKLEHDGRLRFAAGFVGSARRTHGRESFSRCCLCAALRC